jgi:pimeloyl-ACP methyl ester carboxylesterase
LLIFGSKDDIIPEEGRETLRAGLPAARVKVFEGLGHNPFWEDPQGVAEAITPFLTTP